MCNYYKMEPLEKAANHSWFLSSYNVDIAAELFIIVQWQMMPYERLHLL